MSGEAIGEVECPHKGCTERCKVYAFKPRTEGRRSVFTGKKYLVCPVHGRIGADGSQAVTDYIMNIPGAIWGAKKPDAKPGNTVKKPDPQRPAPSPKPPAKSAPTKPESNQPKKPWWSPQW